jgi:hypothetical protein
MLEEYCEHSVCILDAQHYFKESVYCLSVLYREVKPRSGKKCVHLSKSADMILFSRKNLCFDDYKWSVYPQNDLRVSGKPDQTPFDRQEGNEVIYLINVSSG